MVETHPEKRLIGYARVSTYGQTLDSQLEQLRAAGCTSRNIYREKVTGARADRRELNRDARQAGPGEVVTVTRIDRLARSTFDLFAIVKRIVDAKAQLRSLAEPWADTGTGRLMIAVLGDWRTWSVILSAPAPPRAAAGRRSAGSIWAVPRN
jgi:DNA invertase Pin-like site-specific DNA recombinase